MPRRWFWWRRSRFCLLAAKLPNGNARFPAGKTSKILLINPSFEDGGPFVSNKAQGVMSLPPDDQTMAGWKVVANGALGQDVAWIDKSNSFGIPASDGNRFVDLTGFNDKPVGGPFGGVRQSIPTVSGFDYVVRFNVGVSSNWPGQLRLASYGALRPPLFAPHSIRRLGFRGTHANINSRPPARKRT